MSEHEKFHYRSLDELTEAVAALGLDLTAVEDVSVLAEPVAFGRRTAPNRLAIHPMEGCDGGEDGSPGPLTVRRYERFAAGGAGLIWLEATAVVAEGRANPRQLMLTEENLPAFRELVARIRSAAGGRSPVLVLQLTHSGRYSKPRGEPAPIIAHHSAVLDPIHGLPPDYPLITDQRLDELQEAYVAAAELAAEAGFDAVDVKSCHRYLLNELLASHTRTDSRYGGDYAGRTRMLRETVAKVVAAVGDRIDVATRMNVYDGLPHPYGWGVSAEVAGGHDTGRQAGEAVPQPDLSEPLRLIGELTEAGLCGISVTAGNPYYRPQINRPSDWTTAEVPPPSEHPLEGVARLAGLTRQVQRAWPGLPAIGAGWTWLRQYFPHFAAAEVAAGGAAMAGVGRAALAYPDFARELLATGRLDRRKVCIVCSSCSQIMRDGGTAGCVVRDSEVYGPIYRAGRARAKDMLRRLADQCRRCADPPCRDVCPAGLDVPAFLDAVAAGELRRAYAVCREAMVLPGACGSVCPSEVTCRGGCVRGVLGEATIAVGEIHQHVAALAVANGWAALAVPEKPSGRKVTVVGAGPAGLACAGRLLEAGHEVTVFDAAAEPGGKLLSVIPTWRMSRDELRAEIEAVFGEAPSSRLHWRMGTTMGRDVTLDALLAEFDAICLAIGVGHATLGHRPEVGIGSGNTNPPLPRGAVDDSLSSQAEKGTGAFSNGENEPVRSPAPTGVIDAEAFLTDMNANPEHGVQGDVAVIGGGNTAADAAVMAKRRGAAEVYLLYRRSYEQMPAWPAERQGLLEAGVHLLLLTQPAGYVTDERGQVRGVRLTRTRLGPPDASGRRRPTDIPDSQYVLPIDLVIEAVGEGPSADVGAMLPGVKIDGGLVCVDKDRMSAGPGRVFAAGDMVNGGATVAEALAEGRRAAEGINALLL